jgi:ABC-2 type transport system ATP-binding protein
MIVTMTVQDANAIAIKATGLTKSYGSIHAVRGLDLTIAAGESVALLGPNGAGKSTTIDMIFGLTRPDQGSVSIFGQSPAAAVRAGRIGGMLQTASPPDHLKVREFVALVASYYPRPLPVDEVLELTGASEFADQWTTKLSGGQVQRARFAAALVGNPDLMMLDEPTAGIDVEGRREFWQAMRHFTEAGKTVLFATHYLEEADEFADRIILVARGQVVADGPATEIKARAGTRTIRATLPGVPEDALRSLAGVVSAERHGNAVVLVCRDADAALSALLGKFPEARDIEVRGGNLEDAFVELTEDKPAAAAEGATR